MKYIVDWCEIVQEGTGANGPWKKSKMSLKDEQGNAEEDVITFLSVQPGQELEGSVVLNPKYKTREFKSVLQKPNFMKKPDISKSVAEAQKRTQEGVQKAQSHTDNAVRTSATMRDSVLLAIAEGKPTEENIQKWRKWLWFSWDDPKEYPPFE